MNCSIKYFILSTLLGISISTLLLSCYKQNNYKYFKSYLYQNSSPSRNFKIPTNIVFFTPITTSPKETEGFLKRKKSNMYLKVQEGDIIAPRELLFLKPVSSGILLNNKALLIIKKSHNHIWPHILKVIHSYDIPIIRINNKSQQLITGWITYKYYDKKDHYLVRYQISLDDKKNKESQILIISLLDIKQEKKQKNNNVITSKQMNLFTVTMSNNIINGLNKMLK